MSLKALLNQPVTIVHPADNPTGFDYGVAATRVATFGNLQQTHTSEDANGFPAVAPDTTLTEWLLFLGPAEVIGAVDRVEQGTRVFEVVGDPAAVYGRRGVHHLETLLRCIDSETGGLFPPTALYPTHGLYPLGTGA